jgi:predicted AAA+ superfamily ATPase
MYGLSSDELPASALDSSDDSLGHLILRGTYPELWADVQIETRDWYSAYTQTYLERDVRRLGNIGDLASFERLIKVCAARTAQPINLSDIANDTGTSVPTVKRWLSILEATYIVKFVQPYSGNLTSRIKKAPKMYFMDTGLASYLMGFRDPRTVIGSPQYGALFETLVYSNFVKKHSATGEVPDHFYLQTKSKVGVDLIIQRENKLELVEIKGSTTLTPSMAEQLVATHEELFRKISKCSLVGAFTTAQNFKIGKTEINAFPWFRL